MVSRNSRVNSVSFPIFSVVYVRTCEQEVVCHSPTVIAHDQDVEDGAITSTVAWANNKQYVISRHRYVRTTSRSLSKIFSFSYKSFHYFVLEVQHSSRRNNEIVLPERHISGVSVFVSLFTWVFSCQSFIYRRLPKTP